MREVEGNIWEYEADCVVITTNGDVRKDGACVMGRGVALQAKTRDPHLAYRIGAALQTIGNHVYWMGNICSFPVKHHWREKADLTLIERSANELSSLARSRSSYTFVMPRPGTGNGGLDWKDVKPLMERLPDNVHIVHLPAWSHLQD